MKARIALDAMGGDYGPSVVIPAALEALAQHPGLSFTLVGNEEKIQEVLNQHAVAISEQIKIRHTTQQVAMDESPAQALRNKKDSSMRIAIELVRDGAADACVSAGNTGALMATAKFVLRTLPGVDRPAICSTMPGIEGQSYMLDLGGNIDSSPIQLFQFGVMGVALASALENKSNPTVALLNIGAEDIKGNEQVKQAAALFEESNLNYIGYVEADDIFKGTIDVIVCDGFVGNVALKSCEGTARLLMHFIKEEFTRTPLAKLSALAAKPVLKSLKRRMDPGKYNGASFLGLRGTVIKSHGGANAPAFVTAINEALHEVERSVPARITDQLQSLLEQRRAG